MTNREFNELLEIYGADWARWPVDDRAAAQSLLRDDSEAHAAFAEIEKLDRRLTAVLSAETAGAALRARIGRIPREHSQARPQRTGWLEAILQPWRIGLVAATASAVVGFAIGLTLPPPASDDRGSIDLPSLVYGFDEDDIS